MTHRLRISAKFLGEGYDPNPELEIEVDEGIESWIVALRSFLIAAGFSDELVDDYMRDPYKSGFNTRED